MILRRTAAAACAALAAAAFFTPGEARAEAPVVVELFTSQGCSSCPPADKYLAELATRKDVIALTMPITYWDYLGWKDTLARPEFTARQRQYANTAGSGQVFTPQMIVGGTVSCVGSRKSEVEAALEAARQQPRTELSVAVQGTAVVVEAGAGSASGASTLYVAAVRPDAGVGIARGENAGLSVKYTNVVRRLVNAARWSGERAKVRVTLADLDAKPGDRIVAFLQADGLGPIGAAAQTTLPIQGS
jgi:hypothetical protein